MKRFTKLNNLKVRLSYGLSGNQDIALYQTLPLMRQQNVMLGEIPQIGYVPDRLGNDKLKWETTAQVDFGIEASFFNSRLNVELDFYSKRTKDLLLDVEFPYVSGFKNGFMNVGKISNRGVELMIRTTNIMTKDFTWSTEFNISTRNPLSAYIGLRTGDRLWHTGSHRRPIYRCHRFLAGICLR